MINYVRSGKDGNSLFLIFSSSHGSHYEQLAAKHVRKTRTFVPFMTLYDGKNVVLTTKIAMLLL